ncbi:hypothetical protein CBR_g8514 [Chara braunii]|uniref:Uncharacterized protein n=1 Tax=Chara braunii TaxID=69332 RepID=A0A388KMD7_CHABU|nr:hypothetical protein CBR_g8514 [Chara braunii]|eukprot:GBG71211.1 hypothetical protein CBR_g8514 [Chara braunii]
MWRGEESCAGAAEEESGSGIRTGGAARLEEAEAGGPIGGKSHVRGQRKQEHGGRENVRVGTRWRVFLSPEHSKALFGINSPGPIYDMRSSIGKQGLSIMESAPMYSFGTANRSGRFGRSLYTVPGPGAYNAPSSLGPQIESRLRSPEIYRFGSSTRANLSKVFLTPEHCKANYGIQSPGPSAYNYGSSIGPQQTSRNRSAPRWVFGSEGRFKYDYVIRAARIPGAGQYNLGQSCGKQFESNKTTLPMFTFGSGARDQRAKMYLTREHEKGQFGEYSPGPAAYNSRSSLVRDLVFINF